MANVGRKGIVRYEETFAADNIGTLAGDGIAWVVSSDTGDTAIARAVAAGKGLHATGATAATDDNMIELCSDQLHFSGQEGQTAIELLMQLDDTTNIAFNFGFNDDSLEAGDTLPVELSGTTFTSTSSTFLGFVYDTDATNDDIHCFWVDDDTDTSEAIADLRMNGMAPTDDKWLYLRVEMQDRGSGKGVRATFLAVDHTGKSVEKVFNTSVDRDATLCFYFGVENRSASAHNVYIKLPAWEQSIADM
jgi:hypothetical protein